MKNIKEILENYPSLKLQYEQMKNMRFLKFMLKEEQRNELDRIDRKSTRLNSSH